MTETSTGLQLLAQLFGEQPQPVFWMKPLWGPNETGIIDFEYFYCNAAMYQFSGLSPVQLIGNRISNTLTLKEENKAEVIEQMALVLTSGKKFEGSIYNTQLNKYYSFTRTRVEGGVLTVIQDRTEEYKMIRELETQKNLLNSILTYSPSGISV
ncbi:MAG TPA: hypothetical protein VFR58_06995, partial [Flavisolibacter sp.]|nr:hypothetical protein [Flavisolibacter sp.]